MEEYLLQLIYIKFILYLNVVMLLSFTDCWVPLLLVFLQFLLVLRLWAAAPPIVLTSGGGSQASACVAFRNRSVLTCADMWGIQRLESDTDRFLWHAGDETLGPLVGCPALIDLLAGCCPGCHLTLMKTLLKVKDLPLVLLHNVSLDVIRFFWLDIIMLVSIFFLCGAKFFICAFLFTFDMKTCE